MFRALLVSTVMGLFLAASAAPDHAPAPTAGDEADASALLVADGREIAQTQCAACHALEGGGASPLPEAPAFTGVLSRYRADVLEEELIAGIQVAHPMPDFQFNPQGAEALIAYLRSIQEE
jgi:mono/diheme cytochrome c family protein